MNLSKLGFDLPFCTDEVFYFECQVQIDEEPVTEVSFTDSINNINRLLAKIHQKSCSNHQELSVISPRLVSVNTGEMVPKKKYEVIYGTSKESTFY